MENAHKYLRQIKFGTFPEDSIISFVDLMMIDWEYGLAKADWDKELTSSSIKSRLVAFNSVNDSKNTICFNWCYFKNIALIHGEYQELGWNDASMTQWTCQNLWKTETKSRDFVLGADLVCFFWLLSYP